MKIRIIIEDGLIGYREYLKYAPKIDVSLELQLFLENEVFPKIADILHEETRKVYENE